MLRDHWGKIIPLMDFSKMRVLTLRIWTNLRFRYILRIHNKKEVNLAKVISRHQLREGTVCFYLSLLFIRFLFVPRAASRKRLWGCLQILLKEIEGILTLNMIEKKILAISRELFSCITLPYGENFRKENFILLYSFKPTDKFNNEFDA